MLLVQVKKFNSEGDRKYREAVEKWDYLKGGFPFRPMYVYVNEDTGADKKKGWVLTDKTNSMWFSSRKKALEHFERNGDNL